MLEGNLSVARGRGGIGARFGYNEMSDVEKHSALFWIALLFRPQMNVEVTVFALSLVFSLDTREGQCYQYDCNEQNSKRAHNTACGCDANPRGLVVSGLAQALEPLTPRYTHNCPHCWAERHTILRPFQPKPLGCGIA